MPVDVEKNIPGTQTTCRAGVSNLRGVYIASQSAGRVYNRTRQCRCLLVANGSELRVKLLAGWSSLHLLRDASHRNTGIPGLHNRWLKLVDWYGAVVRTTVLVARIWLGPRQVKCWRLRFEFCDGIKCYPGRREPAYSHTRVRLNADGLETHADRSK